VSTNTGLNLLCLAQRQQLPNNRRATYYIVCWRESTRIFGPLRQ